MNALTLKVELSGTREVDALLQDMRNKLTRRGRMHARMAVAAKQETQEHLRSDKSHNSAERLGAKPTGFRNKSASLVSAQSDEDEGRVVIPRSTGLGRAFGDVVIRPGSGRTYITQPAHQATYGRSARDPRHGDDPFQFAVIHSWKTFLALVFKKGKYKGEVAYWLRREVHQKQKRTLLPSDEVYIKVSRLAAVKYLTERVANSA